MGKWAGKRPTYYLWKLKDADMVELERQKDYYISMGFRVVIFMDGDEHKDIHEGLKAVIQNHRKL